VPCPYETVSILCKGGAKQAYHALCPARFSTD
jgi:hypothetical protein